MSVAIICCFTFTVVAAVSGANVRGAVISKDLTVRNVSTLETINDLVQDLINQTASMKTIVAISATGDEENNRTPGPAPLEIQQEEEEEEEKEEEEEAVDTRRVSQNHQKRILGLWTRPNVTPKTKDLNADLSNKHVESGQEYSSSAETKSNNDRRNDFTPGDVSSHYVPNFHLSIKIGRDDSYISENLALLHHLNESTERLREFNDKYERLIANNEAINRNVGKLNNNSVAIGAYEDANAFTKNDDGVPTTAIGTIGTRTSRTDEPLQPSADSSFTAASALNSRTSETNPRVNNNDIINEIRANLMA